MTRPLSKILLILSHQINNQDPIILFKTSAITSRRKKLLLKFSLRITKMKKMIHRASQISALRHSPLKNSLSCSSHRFKSSIL